MHHQSFNNVLFVGVGGGNDVYSCLLAMRCMQKQGWRWENCSFAGVQSPFHLHSTTDTEVPGFTKVSGGSTRHIVQKDSERQIPFIDAVVARLVDKELYDVDGVYNLSLSQGTIGVSEIFRKLYADGCAYGKFDFFVLVDVGGDCLYRGKEDWHILSPMFDAITIRGFIDSEVPGIMFEGGVGSDGEMDPSALKEAIAPLAAEEFTIDESSIKCYAHHYEKHVASVRSGNTVRRTTEAYHAGTQSIHVPFDARNHLGIEKKYFRFTQEIDTALCRKFFLFDPRKIANPFMVECSDPFDWFMKTQVALWPTNCELNMEYLERDGRLCQFLTPSPLLKGVDRYDLISGGLSDLLNGVTDLAWMYSSDHETFRSIMGMSSRLLVEHSGRLLTIRKL